MSGNWRQAMPSPRAYWVSRVLFDIQHKPDHMTRFRGDADAYLQNIPLDDGLKAAIKNNDFGAMYAAGANPYLVHTQGLAMHVPEAEFLASLRRGDRDHG